MRTFVIIITLAVATATLGTAYASTAGPRRGQRFRAVVARHTPRPVKKLVNRGMARLQRARQASDQKAAVRHGRALADVKQTGKTRVRSPRDLLWHPAVHGVASFVVMVGLGFEGTMAAIAGVVVFASSRSAQKTSDGWLALENRSIDVLEQGGVDAARGRLRNQGAKNPDAAVRRLQRNRQLRNASYR
ncbi:MAG TPA: hypothetical protein VIG06_05140 [Kofleriaceae bacterium]|jgi:hypothetical protein